MDQKAANGLSKRASVTPHQRWPHVWVAGYCNDMFGYIPTRRIQHEGGYEAGRANLWSWVPSPWTDDVEDRITAVLNPEGVAGAMRDMRQHLQRSRSLRPKAEPPRPAVAPDRAELVGQGVA